jgi:hypothetical protein
MVFLLSVDGQLWRTSPLLREPNQRGEQAAVLCASVVAASDRPVFEQLYYCAEYVAVPLSCFAITDR